MNKHEEVLEESALNLDAEMAHINALMEEEELEVAMAIVESEDSEVEEVKEVE